MFCPKCKSILLPKKVEGKKVMACSCGYNSTGLEQRKVSEKSTGSVDVAVVDREIETMPLCAAECPKCEHDQAYYWMVQTRAGDEAETKFLKCQKCKHTWREYR